ncbi:TPA: hypothetical protein P0E29_000580 [Vibrio harveyi]|nr:hypothetical protein [Vibrio harveyi]
MKVIDAVWEQRNIGLATVELIFDTSDTIDNYRQWVRERVNDSVDYNVAKVPVGDAVLTNHLLNDGFEFLELITEVSVTQLPILSRIQERMLSKLSYAEMQASDMEYLFEQIRLGLFKTDRVALDPKLGLQKSISRYIGWLTDELSRGARFYRINFNQEFAGFFILGAAKGNKITSILAGIFESHQRYALGFFMNYFAYVEAFELGAKAVYTNFSSNNRGASSIHYSIACNLHNQYYVLSKMKGE